MRLRDGWWKTNWSLMSRKLRYLSADRLPGGKVSLLKPFAWRSIHSILQCCENPLSNSRRCSFFWSKCLSHCQVLLLSCQIFEQSPFIPHSQSRDSIVVSLILSKLDYCYSLLAGLPQTQIKRVQAAQNATARTVIKCKKTEHVTPIFQTSLAARSWSYPP